MADVYGYVRVSTRDQNEERQLIALQKLSVAKKNIFMDNCYDSIYLYKFINSKD